MSHPALLPLALGLGSGDPGSSIAAWLTSRDSVPEGMRAAFSLNNIEQERTQHRISEKQVAQDLLALREALQEATSPDKGLDLNALDGLLPSLTAFLKRSLGGDGVQQLLRALGQDQATVPAEASRSGTGGPPRSQKATGG